MKSLQQQTDDQIARTRQAKPEFMQAVDDLMATARKFEEGGAAIAIGQRAPDFELPDALGEAVALSCLCAKGPVVVSFYRGSWCPYCNLELRALQTRLGDIRALGADLVAISPQKPDESLTQTERDALEFTVLSDQDARVAAQYGVAWEVPELILEHMRKDRNLDLAEINNGSGRVLPIPATFVLGRDGVVAWRYVDVDYRTRAEPEDVVAALRNLI
jgi:peroxiredoxin